MGYVAPDIDKAIDFWTGVAGAGPFYTADYEPERQMYRGARELRALRRGAQGDGSRDRCGHRRARTAGPP